MSTSTRYIPALRFHWLTPLYDPLFKWVMRENIIKGSLIAQAKIKPGMRVLDLGCGTGTLTIMIKQAQPQAEVFGLDVDLKVVDIAQSKAFRACTKITFEQGLASRLPYPNNWFDRVLSSLVLHHLNTQEKQQTLNEVYRVLRTDTELHILDFGVPHGIYAWIVSQLTRRLEPTEDNIRGLIPEMIRSAGFERVIETANYQTIFGSISLYQAVKLA